MSLAKFNYIPKPAVIKVTWEIIVPMNSWDDPDDEQTPEEHIDFFLNGSSACSSRYIEQLADEEERAHDGCCFSCHRFEGKFIRWATEQDIEQLTPPKPKAVEQ